MPGVLRYESGDQRLPVFDTDDPDTQTVSIQDGPVTATASAYGEPFAYLPEHRPVMAIDGDPATSWTRRRSRAGARRVHRARRERADRPRHPAPARHGRRAAAHHGTSRSTVDDRDPIAVALDESLARRRRPADRHRPDHGGQPDHVRITGTGTGIDVLADRCSGRRRSGFATIDVGLEPTTELIRVPVDATTAMTDADATTPLSMVFTRLRTDPTDRWRSDPEPALRRQFDGAERCRVRHECRAARRPAHGRRGARRTARRAGRGDGSPHRRARRPRGGGLRRRPDTSWITPFGSPVGQRCTSPSTAPPTPSRSPSRSGRSARSRRSGSPTRPDRSISTSTRPAPTWHSPARSICSDATIEIIGVDEQHHLDRRFGEAVVLPAAISEITFDGTSPGVDTGRRSRRGVPRRPAVDRRHAGRPVVHGDRPSRSCAASRSTPRCAPATIRPWSHSPPAPTRHSTPALDLRRRRRVGVPRRPGGAGTSRTTARPPMRRPLPPSR